MKSLGVLVTALAAIAAGPAAGAEKLRIGYLPVTGHAKFFVAQEQGFFAKEGLEVELVEFVNSADGINALVAGKVDLGAFGTTAPLVHISRGTDLKIIGGVMGEDAAIITTPANAGSIKGVADLRGKKVATVRLASGDAVLRGALHDAGLDWRKDLQIFELKNPPAVIEAVKSGQVDAGVVWGPHDYRAEEQGLRIVSRSNTLQPGHPCCRLTVRASALRERARWVRLVRAILRAEKFTREDHQHTVDAIVKYLKLDRGLVEKAFYSGFVEQNTDPNLKGIRRFWKTMQESQFIDTKESIDSHVELGVYKEALDGLAKESPKEPVWAELQKKFPGRNL
ncbi:MAG: ABC transporter substrate-binding protein [Anaeromyxobacteraceae bacterium]